MNLRVWWNKTTGFWTPKPTGQVLTGIVVCGGGQWDLIVRDDHGKFHTINPYVVTKSEWVDRP